MTDYISSFKSVSYTRIKLELYKMASDSEASKCIWIEDGSITDILSLLRALPDAGDKMKKIGDAEHMKVCFYLQDGKFQYVSFYNGHIKTPKSGFYASSNNDESLIYKLLKQKFT